jgi:hypothetical protein
MFPGKPGGFSKFLGFVTLFSGVPSAIDYFAERNQYIPPFKGYIDYAKIVAINKTDTVISKQMASCPSHALNFSFGYKVTDSINDKPFLVKMQYNTYVTEDLIQNLFKKRIKDLVIESDYYPDKSYDEINETLSKLSLDELDAISRQIQFNLPKSIVKKN